MINLSNILFYTVEKKRYKGKRVQYPKGVTLTDEQISIVVKAYNVNPEFDKRELAERLFMSYEKLMGNLRVMGKQGMIDYKQRKRTAA